MYMKKQARERTFLFLWMSDVFRLSFSCFYTHWEKETRVTDNNDEKQTTEKGHWHEGDAMKNHSHIQQIGLFEISALTVCA